MDRASVKRIGWIARVDFKLVVLEEWVVVRKENGRRFFFETIDYRPQTEFDWPHSMLATSRQRMQ